MSSKSFRVRTQVGKDQNLTFELKQDFDLLEILSLSLTQREVYTRMCADFGVVCGRVIVNGGFGVPNAKVSIFIPLEGVDESNEVIKQIYPYKQPFDKGSEGVRYNLLSKDPNFACHIPVGTFPRLNDVLTQQDVEYVFKKYYKFTAKTNEAGDFMIYGVPVGSHSLVMDVDLSDIGCFSMLPEDFKIKGSPESDFDGPKFRSDNEIDSLPQIVNQTKVIEINPFWGDEDECQAAITRVDFDLGVAGIRIDPTAVFMGSTGTDTHKDYVNKNCRPKRHMGELCSLITQPGIIDCVRYTTLTTFDEDAYGYGAASTGGTVPVLERYYLQNGGRVIDATGAWLEHIPMNLDHITTDEFGDLVLSYDPEIGVATRARVRFRVRPEQASGSARFARRASFLLPNLREYNSESQGDWPGIDYRSYAFSVKYSDYHPHAQQELMPAAKDYFYDMTFNRVYTPSQFHDHVKHAGRRQFIGVKEIMPEAEQQCATSAMFFPVNSAVRRNKFIISLYIFLLSILMGLYFFLQALAAVIALIVSIVFFFIFLIIWIVCVIICALISLYIPWPLNWYPFGFLKPFATTLGCGALQLFQSSCPGESDGCSYYGFKFGIVLYSLHQQKYPECERCKCRAGANSDMLDLSQSTCCELMDANCGGLISISNPSPCPVGDSPGSASIFNLLIWGDDICCPEYVEDDEICCPDNYGYDSTFDGTGGPGVDGWNEYAGGGCYVKVICVNIACLSQNFNMKVIREYVRREKVAVALCNGIMNYFWENNWVNGFLYQYQFKAKLQFAVNGFTDKKGDVHDTYTDSSYCKKVVYVHPIDHVFYYRSCPAQNTNQANPGAFMGDEDGVYSPWWDPGNLSSNIHAPGDMNRHILFPTTIVDMGSRNQCIQQVCLDERFATECSVTDQIGSTTFQDITDLISDTYNMKMDNPNMAIRTFFPRPEKEIGGDVAQALMQNCMVGVYGYESNVGGTECDCPNPGPTTTLANNAQLEYPVTNNSNTTVNGGSSLIAYVPNALNVMDAMYDIKWEPLMFTASTQVIMSGQDLIDCLTLDLASSSQEVPFYPWHMMGAPGNIFGNWTNDWDGTLGEYEYEVWGGGDVYWTSPFGLDPILTGDYQNDMLSSMDRPILTPTSETHINFSQPLFYYFGLRPGQTAYNTFVRKYVDEELSNTVL